nr:MAG TPA: hypothetical protein [Caudoviricetes sp.]
MRAATPPCDPAPRRSRARRVTWSPNSSRPARSTSATGSVVRSTRNSRRLASTHPCARASRPSRSHCDGAALANTS